MSKIDQYLEAKRKKLQQFQPIEINAEILRQNIKELQQAGHRDREKPANKGDVVLKRLKQRLASIEIRAHRMAEGRELVSGVMDAVLKTGIHTTEGHRMLQRLKTFLDTVDQESKEWNRREIDILKWRWPMSTWQQRRRMLRRSGRSLFGQYMVHKPLRFMCKGLFGMLLRLTKKVR